MSGMYERGGFDIVVFIHHQERPEPTPSYLFGGDQLEEDIDCHAISHVLMQVDHIR